VRGGGSSILVACLGRAFRVSVHWLSGNTPYMLVSLDLIPDGDQVRGIYVVTNPDKLSRLG
jgi:hypothetical protein